MFACFWDPDYRTKPIKSQNITLQALSYGRKYQTNKKATKQIIKQTKKQQLIHKLVKKISIALS